MQTSNTKKRCRNDDPTWYLLAEFSMSEFLSDLEQREDLSTGFLFRTVKELGMSLESVGDIELTLANFAKEALAHDPQSLITRCRLVRVFCQNKYRVTNSGGWGYYLIEKGRSFARTSDPESYSAIELYVYQEGK